MKSFAIGLAGVCIGAVAVFLAVEYFDGFKQKPEPATQISLVTLAKAEEKTADLPTNARFAVVSENGRVVVAVTDEKTVIVIRDGKVAGTVKGLRARRPRMALNRDGSRLAAHDIRRGGVVLWNTVESTEVAFYATAPLNVRPQFSPGGNLFGFTVVGQEHVDLYYANSGIHAVKLPGSCRLDRFLFPDPRTTSDDSLVVSLLSEERDSFGHKSEMQWRLGTYGWSRLDTTIVYAMPDMPWDKD